MNGNNFGEECAVCGVVNDCMTCLSIAMFSLLPIGFFFFQKLVSA